MLGFQGLQHLCQLHGHILAWLAQGVVDALHLLLLREALVVGDGAIEQLPVKIEDVPQRTGKVKDFRIPVALRRREAVIVQLPVFGDDFRGGEAVVLQMARG